MGLGAVGATTTKLITVAAASEFTSESARREVPKCAPNKEPSQRKYLVVSSSSPSAEAR